MPAESKTWMLLDANAGIMQLEVDKYAAMLAIFAYWILSSHIHLQCWQVNRPLWHALGRQFILHLWCSVLFLKCFSSLCLLDYVCMKPTCLWIDPVIYLHTQVQNIWRGGIIAYNRTSHPSNIKNGPSIGFLLIHLTCKCRYKRGESTTNLIHHIGKLT